MSQDKFRTCFVVSPIGQSGTKNYEDFKHILDYMIKPAVEGAGLGLRVIRADEIQRPGSFIKDILEMLLHAHVVIADLSHQNPNVFYELGVRHSLSARTILIAQDGNDIPSDLKEYRYVVYEPSLPGAAQFGDKIKKFLEEIETAPERPDSPVLDRLPSISQADASSLNRAVDELRRENEELKRNLSSLRRSKGSSVHEGDDIPTRLGRVLTLMGMETRDDDFDTSYYRSPSSIDRAWGRVEVSKGRYQLFSPAILENEEYPRELNYIATITHEDTISAFADMRMLMHMCRGTKVPVKFTLVSHEDWAEILGDLRSRFESVLSFLPQKEQGRFSLGIWDKLALSNQERALGLLV